MLDRDERRVIWFLMTHGPPTQEQGAPSLKTLLNVMRAATLSPHPCSTTLASQGYFVQFVQVGRVPNARLKEVCSKSFWETLAVQERLPMPSTVVTCMNGRKTYNAQLQSSSMYIYKPDNAWGGRGIKLVSGTQVHELPCNQDDYSIQQRLRDCSTGGKARSFRVITMFDGSVFRMYSVQAKSTSRVTSNFGTAHVCHHQVCDRVPTQGMHALQRLAQRLAQVHGHRLGDLFCIGWDCMLDCNDEAMEAYVLEGNIFCSALLDGSTLDDAAEFKARAQTYMMSA